MVRRKTCPDPSGVAPEDLPVTTQCESGAETTPGGATAAAPAEGRAPLPAQAAAGPETGPPGPSAEPTVPLDQHQRLLAEFDNYRKRVERERERAAAWLQAELLSKLLPTMDDIDRARQAAGQDKMPPAMDGMLIILDRLAELLRREGLVEIQAGPGDVFDPNIHEAVLMVPSAEVSEGCIAAVLEKGYRVGDRLLRPTKVAVARAPNTDEAQAKAEEG